MRKCCRPLLVEPPQPTFRFDFTLTAPEVLDTVTPFYLAVVSGMAERKPTDDELELTEDILDMLPDQDCRSPRPGRKLSAPTTCIPVAGPERWTNTLLSSMKTLGSFRRRSRPSEGAADLIKAARDSQEGPLEDADIPAFSPTGAKVDSTVDTDGLADEPCPAADGHIWPLFCGSASSAADRALKAQTPTATEAQGPDVEAPTAAAILSSPFQLNSSQAGGLTSAASERSGEPKAPAPTSQSSNQLSEGNPPVKDVSGDLHAIKHVLGLSAVDASKFAVLAQLLASHEVPSSPPLVLYSYCIRLKIGQA